MQKSMTRRTIVAGVLVVLAAIAVETALLGCGSSDRPSVERRITEHQNYHQKQYDAGIANPWPLVQSDRRVGDYLETSWYYPGDREASFTIYSRTADETGSPRTAADVARVQTLRLPGYSEGGLKEERIRDNPAVHWNFELGDAVYVEYFFEECGVEFVVRETAPSALWDELSSFFDQMSEMVTAKCDG
jgi:hypothetical protein